MNDKDFENLQTVAFDFEQEYMPERAKKLRPQLYQGESMYCFLSGPDPQVGIHGCGNTPQEAIADWERNLDQRIERLTEGDDAAHHAIRHLGQH